MAPDPSRLLFADLKIVELGQYIAAPYAAELFAHGGADVVSVEPVDGGPTRHNSPLGPPGDGRQYVIKARGKRSLPCSLSTPEGREILKRLVDEADVVISNLRPGLASSLGIGWDTLQHERPDLIFAEINGFGDEGPLAEVACVDIVAQAASGLMRSLGRRQEGRPQPTDVMICDYTTGCLLAFGIAAALRHRERTGKGQRVASSLMNAGLTAQHRRASRFDRVDQWHDELLTEVGHEPMDELTAWREEQIGVQPFFYNCFVAADGEIAVGAVATNGPKMLEVLGLDPNELDGPATMKGMTVGETADLVAAHVAGREVEGLVNELRAVGVPCTRINFLEEAMANPDFHAAGLLQQFDHPRLGLTTMPAPPVRFSGVDYEAGTDTPEFGVHTDELLRGLGYNDAVIEQLVADGVVARSLPPTQRSAERPVGF
ncbi:MAG: CoA transferase [Actinomycetia bacterium]|nr:CoA transferase [Actinomycetes bacterium]